MKFKKYFLLYTIIPLFFISISASYYRFMVAEDYLVEYEVACDPEINTCFVGCEDDDCSFNYYYSVVTKNASNLLRQCGQDITDCQSAPVCLKTDDEDCAVRYCEPLSDGDACETIGMKVDYDQSDLMQNANNGPMPVSGQLIETSL